MLRLILTAIGVAGISATGAGITASLSSKGLNYMITQLLPSLEKEFGTITVPDINGNKDDFDYHVTGISCDNFVIAAGEAALAPPSSISASLSGVAVQCHASWSFKLHPWPHVPDGSGTADISVSQTTASLSLALNVSNLRPTMMATAAAINIGSVDITLHGSALDWLLDLFKSDIESAIRSALDTSFPPVLEHFIDVNGNAALQKIPIEVPIPARSPYNVSEARFGFVSQPVATTTFLAFSVQGDVVPLGGTVEPPVPAPALPPFDSSDADYMIEGRFSPYTLTSAAWTYWQANLTQWPIAAANVPLGLNNTNAYGLIAPGLSKAFPNQPVNLQVAFAKVPTLTISPPAAGGISAAAPLSLVFFAGTPPAFAFSLDIDAAFNLDVGVSPSPISPGSLIFNGTLSFISATVTIGTTTVGPVSTGLLQALVDIVLPIAMATLNGDLSRGFPLPAVEGLAFTNATSLQLETGYALFAADFTYAPTLLF
jgi:hypothetical protein